MLMHGQRCQDRGVQVVPTRVHDTGNLRLEGEVGLLLDGERIQVGADQYLVARRPAFDVDENARTNRTVRHRNVVFGEKTADARRALVLVPPQLRMPVQFAIELGRSFEYCRIELEWNRGTGRAGGRGSGHDQALAASASANSWSGST